MDARRQLKWLGAGAMLFAASLAHRFGTLAFHFALGHIGGLELVGTASSVLALVWVLGSFGGLGLPDRAMYGAARDSERSVGPAHGLFLLATLGSAALALAMSLPLHLSAAPFVVALILGAFLQHTAAFTFSFMRGASRPEGEVLAWLVSAVVLAVGAAIAWWVDMLLPLGVAFIVAGLVPPATAAAITRRQPALAPGMPRLADLRPELQQSAPYLWVGAAGTLLGSVDLLATQVLLGSEEAGRLQCATLVMRTGLAAPWMLSALALRRTGLSAHQLPALLLAGLCTWLLAAGVGYLAVPWVGLGYDLNPDIFREATWVALGSSLPSYMATALLPLAMFRRRSALVWVFVGIVPLLALGFGASPHAGLTGFQLVHAGGYLVLWFACVVLLRGLPPAASDREPA